jgi:hypothetical protein
MLRVLRRAVGLVLDRLFVRDGVPLWSGAVFSPGAQELQEEGLNSFSTQWTALATYAERNPARLALGVAVFFALAAAFYWRAGALAAWSMNSIPSSRKPRFLRCPSLWRCFCPS